MYSRQPITCRTNPSSDASGTSSTASALWRTSCGLSRPMLRAGVITLWKTNGCSALIASSYGPNWSNRSSRNCWYAASASSWLVGHAKLWTFPGLSGNRAQTHAMASSTCGWRGCGGTAVETVGDRVALRELLAVLLVEGPLAAHRLVVALHQHAEPLPLPAVEAGHPGAATCAGPVAEVRAQRGPVGEEVGGLQPLGDDGGELLAQPVVDHVVRRDLGRVELLQQPAEGACGWWSGRRSRRTGPRSRPPAAGSRTASSRRGAGPASGGGSGTGGTAGRARPGRRWCRAGRRGGRGRAGAGAPAGPVVLRLASPRAGTHTLPAWAFSTAGSSASTRRAG